MLAKLSRERWVVSNREGKVRRGRSRSEAPGGPENDLPDQARPGNTKRDGARPVVAVTGAARGLGQALAARLAAGGRVGRVIAIDDHRGEAPGVTWRVYNGEPSGSRLIRMAPWFDDGLLSVEVGRASCRERVFSSV